MEFDQQVSTLARDLRVRAASVENLRGEHLAYYHGRIISLDETGGLITAEIEFSTALEAFNWARRHPMIAASLTEPVSVLAQSCRLRVRI